MAKVLPFEKKEVVEDTSIAIDIEGNIQHSKSTKTLDSFKIGEVVEIANSEGQRLTVLDKDFLYDRLVVGYVEPSSKLLSLIENTDVKGIIVDNISVEAALKLK